MDKTIKTRSVIKDIKTLERHITVAPAIKTAGTKLKDSVNSAVPTTQSEGSTSSKESPTAKAEDMVSSAAFATARTVVAGSRAARTLRARNLSKETARKTAKQSTITPTEMKITRTPPKLSKTLGRDAGRVAKTPQRVSSSAAHSATVTPAPTPAKTHVMRATRAQHTTPRSAAGAVRAVKRGATSFVKMAMASARTLSTALAVVGGTTASLVVVICLVASIAASAFGIFFTGGDMGDDNPSLREVVAEINAEHAARIDEMKTSNPHDEVALSGSKTSWKEVLATFAVKTTTDTQRPLDAMTLDAERQGILKDIFWEMNDIDSEIEEKTIVEIVLEEDNDGNFVETNKEITKKVLRITLSSKSADDIATQDGFTSEQIDLLYQLLDVKYDAMWQSVLYGIGRGNGDIVEVAAAQVGNAGGQPYWSWYGFSGRVEWCACFVSWCANECGYIEQGTVPKFSYCPTGVQWFKDVGQWKDGGYAPQPGNIVFFDWGADGVSDHVGIVESCDGVTIHTIEGNSGDACQRNSYNINSSSILGYGTPLE